MMVAFDVVLQQFISFLCLRADASPTKAIFMSPGLALITFYGPNATFTLFREQEVARVICAAATSIHKARMCV